MSAERVCIIGGGPAGLMAAERLAADGRDVTVFEKMPSVGRKFLLAGRSGLNLTHGEPLDRFLSRYGPDPSVVTAAVAAHPPDALRSWAAGLGQATFVGSSGRVFPEAMRATPLLRSWLSRLTDLGVDIRVRHRWEGWERTPDSRRDPGRIVVTDPAGVRHTWECDATILALGGASWPRVGSDGRWTELLADAGVPLAPLEPSNCGVAVSWNEHVVARFAGTPLKNVAVSVRCIDGASPWVRGDAMVTATGLEAGPIYSNSAEVRAALAAGGECVLLIDLHPDLTVDRLADRLQRRRPKDSASTWLRRAGGLSPVAVAVVRHALGADLPADPLALAALLKELPLTVSATMPIDRAISTAGGIRLDALDDDLMVRRLPGVFVAGEMLDWDAPTGGYLLQASFATGVAAARGVSHWLDRHVEVADGDILWRVDRRFLESRWTCIWGRGCQGIGVTPDEHSQHGCCSLGAEIDGLDEARLVAVSADLIPPRLFQHHADARAGGVMDDAMTNTRVVDGACIFLNRPGFEGGAGCALHLAALDADESPIDWKPSVCWQLPVKVDWVMRDDDIEVATVRGWERRDWGDDGDRMAWCCTEESAAHVGEVPVVESLAEELSEIMGHEVFVELKRRLG